MSKSTANQTSKPCSYANQGEQFAESILKEQSWVIVARNLRRQGFELDIVAWKGKTLAIIEVKSRRHPPATMEQAALLSYSKSRALRRGAAFLTDEGYIPSHIATIRIDLALVIGQPGNFDLSYIANAIEM